MDLDLFLVNYNDFYEEDIIKHIKLHIGYNILSNYLEHDINDFAEKDITKHIENNKEYYFLLADKFLAIYGDMFNQINEIVYIMFLLICESLVDIKNINPNINEDITMEELHKEIYNMLNIILVLYESIIDPEDNFLYLPDIINETLTWNQVKENFYKKYNKTLILNDIKKYNDIINETFKIDSEEYDINQELINSLIIYWITKNINKYILRGE